MDDDKNYTGTTFKLSNLRRYYNVYSDYRGIIENPFEGIEISNNASQVHDILDSIEKYTIEEDEEGRKYNYSVTPTSFILTPYS